MEDKARLDRLLEGFRATFPGQEAEAVIRVPGRVNLIGEHIDFCGFAVLPMAIYRDILVAVGKAPTGVVLANLNTDRYPDVYRNPGDLSLVEHLEVLDKSESAPKWFRYFLCGVKGALVEGVIPPGGRPMGGINIVLDGQIPPSAGLSSSSAVVVAGALATCWRGGVEPDPLKLAETCARCERFIGTQGGGMDQAIELNASKGTAKIVEFNPLKLSNVPLPDGAVFVIANSLVEVNKADADGGSKFNVRVAEAKIATKIMAKSMLGGNGDGWKQVDTFKALQEATGKSFEEMIQCLEQTLRPSPPYSRAEVCQVLALESEDQLFQLCNLSADARRCDAFELYRRAKHILSEARRVGLFRDICQGHASTVSPGDVGYEAARVETLKQLGALMFESHQSCSEVYDCSLPQLDELVQLAKDNGAYGARLTGAGWGGCTVHLVDQAKVDVYIRALIKGFFSRINSAKVAHGFSDVVFPAYPGDGAKIFPL